MNDSFATIDKLREEGEHIDLTWPAIQKPLPQSPKFLGAPPVYRVCGQTVVVDDDVEGKFLCAGYIPATSRDEDDWFFWTPDTDSPYWTHGYEHPKSLLIKDRFTLFDSPEQILEFMSSTCELFRNEPYRYAALRVVRDTDRHLGLEYVNTFKLKSK